MATFVVASSMAHAVTFSGSLANPADAALVASDLSAPQFGDDFAISNNLALHAFTVAADSTVTFTSTSYVAGGIDPYFSLFAGAGLGATFLASNYALPDGDFTFTTALAAGTYQIALGTVFNESFAENLGSGTLADGFIGLGGPSFLGDGRYAIEVDVVPGVSPVPEPADFAVIGLGLAAIAARAARRLPSSRTT